MRNSGKPELRCHPRLAYLSYGYEHRSGLIAGFTKRYGLKRLIWFEQHDDIRSAIQRETTMKHWPRAWKVRVIHAMNPEWRDLYDELF